MEVNEPDLSGTYSYADYLSWTNWNQMVELIYGKVYKMSPAPTSLHQRVSRELLLQMGTFLRKKKCEVFDAPFDVRIPVSHGDSDEKINTVVQPDLCVICDPSKIDERGCLGAPDWIIEIISKHTSEKDLHLKFELYESSGVKEYWVVYPHERSIIVFVLNEHGKYQAASRPYTQKDSVQSFTIPGLCINLEEVFQDKD
jgi:Uma2 family endonuclease